MMKIIDQTGLGWLILIYIVDKSELSQVQNF